MKIPLLTLLTLITFQLSFSQSIITSSKGYQITHLTVMNLDKTVPSINGVVYYRNKLDQYGSGEIVITKNNLSIILQKSYGDPDISVDYYKIEEKDNKTIYYSENSQLSISKGTITDFKKEQEIQFSFDFDKTLQHYSSIYIFQTVTNLDNIERNTADDISMNEEKEKLQKEKEDIKQKISSDYIFDDASELSTCAKFIGDPDELITYYKKNPENHFSISLIVDEKENFVFDSTDISGYSKPLPFDTSFLNKILKFYPAKKIIGNDTFFVKSSITLVIGTTQSDFLQPSNISGVVTKKRKITKIISTMPADKMQMISDKIDFNEILKYKKDDSYQFNLNIFTLDVFAQVSDKRGTLTHIITEQKNINKSILELTPHNSLDFLTVTIPTNNERANIEELHIPYCLDQTLDSQILYYDHNLNTIEFISNSVLLKNPNHQYIADDNDYWTIVLSKTYFEIYNHNNLTTKVYSVLSTEYDKTLRMQIFKLANNTGTYTHDLSICYDKFSKKYQIIFNSLDNNEDYQFQEAKSMDKQFQP